MKKEPSAFTVAFCCGCVLVSAIAVVCLIIIMLA